MGTTMRKHFFKSICGAVLLGLFVLSASSNQSVVSDSFTGHYYIHGKKILSTSGWFDSEIRVIDTIHFSSVVTIKLMEDKSDTLLFFGLPGADEGENRIYGGFQRHDHVAGMAGFNQFERDRIYGSISDNNFEIKTTRPSGRLIMTGIISNDTIEMQGEFLYRGIKVNYELTGEKIYSLL